MLLTLARVTAAALLIASAAAFATGAAIERHTASSDNQPALHHTESGTPGENPASAEPATSRESPATHATSQAGQDGSISAEP